MNRKFIVLFSLFSVFWITTAAMATESNYLGFSLGPTLALDSSLDYGTIFAQDDTGNIVSVPNYQLDSSFKTGMNINLIFGHRYSDNLRIEGEVGYKQNSFENTWTEESDIFPPENIGMDGEVQSLSFLLSCYYDLANNSPLTPYIGAGVGFSHVIFDGTVLYPEAPEDNFSIDDNDTRFAYQAATGVSYAYSKQVTFDLGYKYFSVPTLEMTDEIGDSFETDYSAHNVALGVRLAF